MCINICFIVLYYVNNVCKLICRNAVKYNYKSKMIKILLLL